MVKKHLFPSVVVIIAILFLYVSGEPQSSAGGTDSITSASMQIMKNGDPGIREIELTLEELKVYDGTGGKPVFVAVDGVVYDVTDTKAWKKGNHKGYKAGTDISDLINKKSPHGIGVLKKRRKVGKIITDNK